MHQVLGLGLAAVIGVVLLFSAQPERQLGAWSLAALLVAALALGLTLLNVLELLGGSSGKGGSYGLVFETLGGAPSFLTGWSMLAAQATLVAALLLFAGRALGRSLAITLGPQPLAFVLLLPLLALQAFQYGRGRGLTRTTLALLSVAVLTLLALTLPAWSAAAARPEQAPSAGEVWRLAGRFSVLYLAIEAVLATRRQIRTRVLGWGRGVAGAAAVAVVLALIWLLVTGGLTPASITDPLAVLETIAAASGLPRWVPALVTSAAALFSAGSLLLLGARQLNDLTRRGSLPPQLRQSLGPFSLPPLLFAAFGVMVGGAVLLAPRLPLLDVAGSLLLISLTLLNLAAISSRRSEPDRRRILELPLFPLFPMFALVVILTLLLNLSPQAHLAVFVWTAVGSTVYLAYGRKHQAAAQEGVALFGADQRVEKEQGTYRILVPLEPGEPSEFLLGAATALAGQLGGDVMPLQVITVPDPMALERGRRRAQERNDLFRRTTQRAAAAGVTMYPATRLARTVAEGIIDTAVEEQCDLLLLPWDVGSAQEGQGERMGAEIRSIISQSPCDVAVVAQRDRGQSEEMADGEEWGAGIERILVPTAGGPHAPLAVGLAWALGRRVGARVVATYVAGEDASEAEITAGEAHIRRTLEQMEVKAAKALHQEQDGAALELESLDTEVVRASDVVTGILQASEQADLVFIGASEESLVDQVLFGNLPRSVADACRKPLVMVRRHRGLPRMWIQRVWDAAFQALPTLGAEQKLDVYKQVRRGARPDADFFIMMAVATLIGTIGLMQNSAAVIIGSMLVAPLFTPILAVSLGLAQGDIRMLRVALEAMIKGVFLGAVVAAVTAWASPLNLVTDEILLRTQPNLFDLGVALAAGVAGGYAIAREQVAAALPGVAIAAALVPPIGVVGFGLAIGDLGMAGGAGLLVMTNLIAIAMAGSVTLLLLGFRPGRRAERGHRLRRGLLVAVLLLVVIAVPLAAFFGRAVRETRTEQAIQEVVSQYFAAEPEVQFVGFQFESDGDQIAVEVTVWAEQELPANAADELAQALNEILGRRVDLRIQAVQVQEVESRTE